MQSSRRRELGFRERVRLIVALVILAGFAVLAAWGIGVELHGRSETLDSLEHWQRELEEEARAPQRTTGIYAPAARIQRLEAELDAIPERLFALCSVFALMTILVVLGYRVLRFGRRTP